MKRRAKRSVADNPAPRPIAGEQFRQAVRLPVGGTKRRKLIGLIAAYHDADQYYRPTVDELTARIGTQKSVKTTRLLCRLEADGWLTIHRPKNTRWWYELHLEGPINPSE